MPLPRMLLLPLSFPDRPEPVPACSRMCVSSATEKTSSPSETEKLLVDCDSSSSVPFGRTRETLLRMSQLLLYGVDRSRVEDDELVSTVPEDHAPPPTQKNVLGCAVSEL